MRLLGLDEAGRGCVLGPLAVGGFLVELDQEPLLKLAGAADSKELSPRRRLEVRTRLEPLGKAAVELVSAQDIDAGNINELELRCFARLIIRFRPERVLLDAPCNPAGIPAFVRRLKLVVLPALGYTPEIVAEPKADARYPVVGAASIFAKLARDAEIEALGPVGSGYPSDPVTRSWLSGFLVRNEPFPSCVRTRWGTIDKLRQQQLFGP